MGSEMCIRDSNGPSLNIARFGRAKTLNTQNVVNNTTYGLGMCDIEALLGNFAEYERLPVPGVYLYASEVKLKRPAWVY